MRGEGDPPLLGEWVAGRGTRALPEVETVALRPEWADGTGRVFVRREKNGRSKGYRTVLLGRVGQEVDVREVWGSTLADGRILEAPPIEAPEVEVEAPPDPPLEAPEAPEFETQPLSPPAVETKPQAVVQAPERSFRKNRRRGR